MYSCWFCGRDDIGESGDEAQWKDSRGFIRFRAKVWLALLSQMPRHCRADSFLGGPVSLHITAASSFDVSRYPFTHDSILIPRKYHIFVS